MSSETASDKRIVGYVPGAWDMFHIGHLNLLSRSRGLCDYLVVGVTTDEELLRVKGRRPLVPLAERMEMVAAFSMVDDVVADYHTDKRDAWNRVHFDVLFKGNDWQGTAKGDALEAQMAEVGARVHYLPYTGHTSSTRLRALIGAV